MVYCHSCGEEVQDSSRYCSQCGTRLEPGKYGDDVLEEFWGLVDEMIEGQIRRVESSDDLSIPASLLDRYTFSIEMYIIGFVKGLTSAILWSAFIDDERYDVEDLDLSPVYQRIVDSVGERSDRIREALEKPESTGVVSE